MSHAHRSPTRIAGLGLGLVLASATIATAQDQLKCYKIKDPLKLKGTVDLCATASSPPAAGSDRRSGSTAASTPRAAA